MADQLTEARMVSCYRCKGTGQLKRRRATITCSICHGTGKEPAPEVVVES